MPSLFDDTVLLCHFDEKFKDYSKSHHAVTETGATIDDTIGQFGGSAYLSANGDTITIGDHDDFTLSDSGWTIDFWFYYESGLNNCYMWAQTGTGPTGGVNYFNITYNGVTDVLTVNAKYDAIPYSYTYGGVLADPAGLSVSTWYHVAITFDGTTMYLFIDGILIHSLDKRPDFLMPNCTSDVTMFPHYLSGIGGPRFRLDELRVINGQAAWTADFTPPTSRYNGVYNMNRGELRTEVESITNRTDRSTEVNTRLNWALDSIAGRHKWRTLSAENTDTTLVASTKDYSIPSTLRSVESVRQIDTTDETAAYLHGRDRQELLDEHPYPEGETETVPEEWTRIGDNVRVNPVPSSDEAGDNLYMTGQNWPTQMTNDSHVSGLTRDLDKAIIYLASAYEFEGQQEEDVANYWKGKSNEIIAEVWAAEQAFSEI